MTETDHILVFDEDRDRASTIAGILKRNRLLADPFTVLTFHDLGNGFDKNSGLEELRSGSSVLAIVVEPDRARVSFPGLTDLARRQGVPTLLIVGGSDDPTSTVSRVQGAAGWVAIEVLERELSVRAAEILGRREKTGGHFPSIDPKFLALVVHDLRTPLNVIGLTIRAITQTVPERSAELDEDLMFLKENAGQIEKMLSQLGDCCRLIEGDSQLSAVEFDPRRFLNDFVEAHRLKPGTDAAPVRLELAESGPVEVSLDQSRVKLALQHALSNSLIAAGKTPVRIRSSGREDRWIVEFIIDKPPPSTVVSKVLRPDVFERLSGSAAERRGLDLAITAHLSELFGGTARLVVEPEKRSSVVFDWPQRLATE